MKKTTCLLIALIFPVQLMAQQPRYHGDGSQLTLATNSQTLWVDFAAGTANGVRGQRNFPFDSLEHAIVAASNYDLIMMGAGTGAVNSAVLPLGITVKGSGKYYTVLNIITNTPTFYDGVRWGIVLTNNVQLYDFTIQDTNNTSVGLGKSPFQFLGATNVYIKNVAAIGLTDTFLGMTNITSPGVVGNIFTNLVTCEDCYMESGWDLLANGSSSGDLFKFINCTLFWTTNKFSHNETFNNAYPGSYYVDNCRLHFERIGANSWLKDNFMTNTTWTFVNPRFENMTAFTPIGINTATVNNNLLTFNGGYDPRLIHDFVTAPQNPGTILSNNLSSVNIYSQTNGTVWWPLAPAQNGDWAAVNSNGNIYFLMSTQATGAPHWTSTNFFK